MLLFVAWLRDYYCINFRCLSYNYLEPFDWKTLPSTVTTAHPVALFGAISACTQSLEGIEWLQFACSAFESAPIAESEASPKPY